MYKSHYYLAPPQNLLRKQNKAILMLCKPLFVVHVRVKGLYKLILECKIYWSTKTKHLNSKRGHGTCMAQLFKC